MRVGDATRAPALADASLPCLFPGRAGAVLYSHDPHLGQLLDTPTGHIGSQEPCHRTPRGCGPRSVLRAPGHWRAHGGEDTPGGPGAPCLEDHVAVGESPGNPGHKTDWKAWLWRPDQEAHTAGRMRVGSHWSIHRPPAVGHCSGPWGLSNGHQPQTLFFSCGSQSREETDGDSRAHTGRVPEE